MITDRHLMESRLAHRDRLRELQGTDLFQVAFRRTGTIEQVADALALSQHDLRVAGRVLGIERGGQSDVLTLNDGSGQIEVRIAPHSSGSDNQILDCVDNGDIVGITVVRESRYPNDLRGVELRVLSKGACEIPSAEDWTRLPAPYLRHDLGLLRNRLGRERVRLRAHVLKTIRHFLDSRSFVEVETPVLVPERVMAPVHDFTLGPTRIGQSACLRTTNTDFMRRLVSAGFDRVYQIGKQFRDEAVSYKNYPEFTMLTFGLAYATYDDVMSLVEEMVQFVCHETIGRTSVAFLGKDIDLLGPWRRVPMRDALLARTGVDIAAEGPDARIRAFLARSGQVVQDNALLEEVIDAIITRDLFPTIESPTFITEFPFHFGGPAKEVDGTPGFKQRAELFVNGVELMNMSTHQNDPVKLRQWFEDLLEEKRCKGWPPQQLDEAYFKSMDYGAPPCASGGLGVDRLAMLLSGAESITDVLLFPWFADSEQDQRRKESIR